MLAGVALWYVRCARCAAATSQPRPTTPTATILESLVIIISTYVPHRQAEACPLRLRCRQVLLAAGTGNQAPHQVTLVSLAVDFDQAACSRRRRTQLPLGRATQRTL